MKSFIYNIFFLPILHNENNKKNINRKENNNAFILKHILLYNFKNYILIYFIKSKNNFLQIFYKFFFFIIN